MSTGSVEPLATRTADTQPVLQILYMWPCSGKFFAVNFTPTKFYQ